MKQPDILIAKYYFLAFIGILIFFIFAVMMWVLSLSGRCSVAAQKDIQDDKKKKKDLTIVYLLVFVVVCSMAAHAVNQSYQVVVPKNT